MSNSQRKAVAETRQAHQVYIGAGDFSRARTLKAIIRNNYVHLVGTKITAVILREIVIFWMTFNGIDNDRFHLLL
jgi:hypothetical protein